MDSGGLHAENGISLPGVACAARGLVRSLSFSPSWTMEDSVRGAQWPMSNVPECSQNAAHDPVPGFDLNLARIGPRRAPLPLNAGTENTPSTRAHAHTRTPPVCLCFPFPASRAAGSGSGSWPPKVPDPAWHPRSTHPLPRRTQTRVRASLLGGNMPAGSGRTSNKIPPKTNNNGAAAHAHCRSISRQ